MFDAQTAALIRSAPALEGVDPSMLPQELTGIYAELAGLRLRAASLAEQPDYLAQLARIERIATIYEALVDRGAEDHERRAAAFVAATAYQLLARIRPDLEERDELLTTRAIDPRVSAPLLFLIAEQSPDAREAARELAGPRLEDIHRGALVESVEDLALERFEAILERANRLAGLRPGADAPFDERATQALYGLCWSGLVQMVARLAEALDPLILDLVEWVAREPRPYSELIDAWRTSCPRLTVWEDAMDRGLVRREGGAIAQTKVHVTEEGRRFLREHGRAH